MVKLYRLDVAPPVGKSNRVDIVALIAKSV